MLRPSELKAWLEDGARNRPLLLDIREAWERERCRMQGCLHIPMRELPQRVSELQPDHDIVVICQHGGRSQAMANWLARAGFARVHNLVGGIEAWTSWCSPVGRAAEAGAP